MAQVMPEKMSPQGQKRFYRECLAGMFQNQDLRGLLRADGQRRIYEATSGWKKRHPHKYGPVVWELHRRFGKSYEMTLFGFERCFQHPRQLVRYGAPSQKQCVDIVEPIISDILSACPKKKRPSRKGDTWYFHHPDGDSQFILIGCRENADNHRGKASDMILLDECRDIDNFEYVLNTVFGFHCVGRTCPLIILSSTPPETMDHYFIQTSIPKAMENGCYFKETVLTNKDWSPVDEEAVLELCPGGRDGIAWKREALCMHIANPEGLIVPEMTILESAGKLGMVVKSEWAVPEHYNPHTCFDGGFVDYCGVLFGYIDLKAGRKLVIIDELWKRKLNSLQWKNLIEEKEKLLFGAAQRDNLVRFADIPKQQQADFAQIFHFPVLPVTKYDRDANLAKMRAGIMAGEVIILDRCQHLIYQLRNGVYAKNGKDFMRSDTQGHCDLIAALIYLYRMAYWNANPYPPAGYTIGSFFIPAEEDGHRLKVLKETICRL